MMCKSQCCCQDLFLGLETKTETLDFRSRDQDGGSSGFETKSETLAIRSRDRDVDKMNSSALESRDHGLEITSLVASIPIGDRALA